MELISKDSIFDEAFKIISTNKLKANSLRQSILQNNNPNDELNLKTIQFLGEIEYDLKSLYDILRDLKISYNDMPNNLIHSSFRNNRIKEENEKNNLNDLDKINNNNILKEPSKTYYITSNKFENKSESNNNNDNKDFYINSCPRPDKFRNISFNSYEGNWNLNLSPLSHKLNSINNKQDKEQGNYINEKYPSDIQQNDNYKKEERNITTKDLPFKKKFKLNFDYDNYLTDYSLNKTNRNSNNERNSNYNDVGQNLNLSDLKNENNNFENKNNNNNNYDTSKFADNKNYSIKNKLLDNENIFTFGAPKNNQNLNNDYVLTFDPNNNNNNLYDKNKEYNNNINNHKIKYSYNDFINNKYNNSNSNNKIEEEEDSNNNIEGEKKEILNKIIPDVFQDKNKLYLLKNELGDNIEEKLLNGNINEEDLFKVVKILKNNQDLMNNKRKKFFPKKKFNQPNDKILLKESLKDKRYSYREFPRGWTSTKDYFVNNGTTFIKNRKGKKY